MNPIEKNHVRTKTFGAVEFLRKCDRFIEAYSRVLSNAVVDQVTCSIHEWKNNTASFDIICESLDVSKVYGVSSFHALEGTQNLPVEEAKVEVVATVPQQIRKTSKKGAVELCGLCNSIGLAGLGIGAVYLMKRAFCSACTSRIANNYGFIKYTDISNEGKISKQEHLQSLHDRHTSDTVCPSCGSDLVERTVKQGSRTGNRFSGCSNYPKCKFSKDIQVSYEERKPIGIWIVILVVIVLIVLLSN